MEESRRSWTKENNFKIPLTHQWQKIIQAVKKSPLTTITNPSSKPQYCLRLKENNCKSGDYGTNYRRLKSQAFYSNMWFTNFQQSNYFDKNYTNCSNYVIWRMLTVYFDPKTRHYNKTSGTNQLPKSYNWTICLSKPKFDSTMKWISRLIVCRWVYRPPVDLQR